MINTFGGKHNKTLVDNKQQVDELIESSVVVQCAKGEEYETEFNSKKRRFHPNTKG